VTLTGSTRVGAIVAAQSRQGLKKQVLELGGSDPFLVLKDAGHRRRRQGCRHRAVQQCRTVLHQRQALQSWWRRWRMLSGAAFVAEVKALPVGDPNQDGIKIGPLARRFARHLA